MLATWIKVDWTWSSRRWQESTSISWVKLTKMTGRGDFSSDDHYIYDCGQESIRRNGVAFMVNKSPTFSTWVQPQKWQNDLGSFPRQTIQHHNNPNLCLNCECQRSWSWSVLWRLTRPSRTNNKKRCPFHHKGLEYKSRNSRGTWSSREVWPCSTKWSGTKANRVLPREHTSQSKHRLPTTQETALYMDKTK